MEALFLYFGKLVITSAVLFGYYHLALRNRTFHHYNRFYLLGTVVISMLLPMLKVSYFTLEVNDSFYLLLNKIQNFNSTKTLNNDFSYFGAAAAIFGLIAFVFLVRFFIGIFKIQTFKKNYPKEIFEGISFYQTNLENAPFSFFRNLFWKDSIVINSDLGRQILKREMVHIEQKHSLDKIFMEIVTVLFWFNPVFWFIKKEINLIHEYLADKKAVKKSDTKAFAQMLLASHFSGNVIPGTSPLLSSNLKKRLKMLKKPKTKFGYAHRILALPVVFTIVFTYVVHAKNKEIAVLNNVIENHVYLLKTEADVHSEPVSKQELLKNAINGDTIKPYTDVQTSQKIAVTVTEENGNRRQVDIEPMPFRQRLLSSYDDNLFTIDDKKVTKQEFINFYDKNGENSDFDFGYHGLLVAKAPGSANFYSAITKNTSQQIDHRLLFERRLKKNQEKEIRLYEASKLKVKNDPKISAEIRNMQNELLAVRAKTIFNTVYDLDGNVVEPEKPVKNDWSLLFFSDPSEDQFIVDGKKVSKDEFVKYAVKVRGVNKPEPGSSVAMLKTESVTNGKILYSYKYEITTK